MRDSATEREKRSWSGLRLLNVATDATSMCTIRGTALQIFVLSAEIQFKGRGALQPTVAGGREGSVQWHPRRGHALHVLYGDWNTP